jgi:transcriptional regulator with XRE-family HTH domain
MNSPAQELIIEILALKGISIRKLALEIRVKPSTLSRIKTGKTETGTMKTYMRILQYKNRMMKQIHMGKEKANA